MDGSIFTYLLNIQTDPLEEETAPSRSSSVPNLKLTAKRTHI